MCGIRPGRRVMLSRSLASRVVFCNSRCNGSSSHSEEQAVLPSTRELQQCFFSAFRFCKREHHGSWAIFCAKGRQFKSVVIETYTCNNTIHDPYLLGKDFRLLTRYSCATYFGKVIGPAPSRGPRASCIQRILGAASVFRNYGHGRLPTRTLQSVGTLPCKLRSPGRGPRSAPRRWISRAPRGFENGRFDTFCCLVDKLCLLRHVCA